MRGSLVHGCPQQVLGAAHAGEDQQAVQPGADSAFDVGVEPVSDHEDPIGGEPAAATSNSAGSGLPTTTSGRRPPSAVVSAATRLPFPGSGPRGDGSVASVFVATQRAPAADRDAGLGQIGPAHVRAVSLDHREWSVSGAGDRGQPGGLDLGAQGGRAHDQHRGRRRAGRPPARAPPPART